MRQKLAKMNMQVTARYSNSILESGTGPEIPKSLVSLLLVNGIGGF